MLGRLPLTSFSPSRWINSATTEKSDGPVELAAQPVAGSWEGRSFVARTPRVA